MLIAKLYLAALLVLSLGGFAIYLRKPRTWEENAINIIAVVAPAVLVMAYVNPGFLSLRLSLIALAAIALATNWLGARWYIEEAQEEFPDEMELTESSMLIGISIMLSPAFLFGALALMRAP